MVGGEGAAQTCLPALFATHDQLAAQGCPRELIRSLVVLVCRTMSGSGGVLKTDTIRYTLCYQQQRQAFRTDLKKFLLDPFRVKKRHLLQQVDRPNLHIVNIRCKRARRV
jgi:hypothetical protein